MNLLPWLQGIDLAPDANVFNEEKATALFVKGHLPPNSVVNGRLSAFTKEILNVPQNLIAYSVELLDQKVSLSPGLKVRLLNLNKADLQTGLPSDLNCESLDAAGSNLREIPDGTTISQRMTLENCTQLARLPDRLKTGSLILRGCTALESLPENMSVYLLDISGCTRIRALPSRGAIHFGRFHARNCVNLEALPDWLENLSVLDLRNCALIDRLPPKLKISDWIDFSGTKITTLPPHLDNVKLRWRGVPVDRRIVFHPETVTSDEILKENNAEVRRVMLERVGFERFVELANAKTLDTDRDKGGERKLLKVVMPSDEDLVCVSFSCPSTGRKYVVRVPPTTRTARAAVAWIAGFDNPNDYKPDMES
jgi:hypothetical protein